MSDLPEPVSLPITRRRALEFAGRGGVAALAVLAGAAVGSGCSSEKAPVQQLTLGTGSAGGAYNAFGKAFAAAVAKDSRSIRVQPVTTSASVDNLHRLGDGHLSLAITTADVAEDAIKGRNPFSKPIRVMALARIYVNYTHLVARADGPVRNLRDLAGQRVGLGASESGAEVIAMRLLGLADLTGAEAVTPRALTLLQSVQALKERSVRAVFWSGGVPTPALADLSHHVPLRLLALDQYVEAMRVKYGPVYTTVTIPAEAYGLPRPVPTIGTGNYLTARPDVPKKTVFDLLRALFEYSEEVMRPVTAGARLEPRFAISTGSVPLHPGAAEYYRSVYG
ncbi:TAXI family TRAP transporter solute-binding subunit [Streptomyces sp. NPDC051320]|uniref:TAXI family TRAP transporter solute-binding subunit n=1 Tax=Streptomyces sp. NPDC051320 TaxID=3154644 RepID=UPI003443E142